MLLSEIQGNRRLDRMSTKPNFWSVALSSSSQAHIWKDGQLEFGNYVLFNCGELTFIKGGHTFLVSESAAPLTAIRFAGKSQLLLEKTDSYQFFKKSVSLPDDLSVILLFRHRDRIVLLIADKNFCNHARCLELDISPCAVNLCLSTMSGLIRQRFPSVADQLQQWVSGMRNPFGRTH